ncbi:MAG: SMI1/KNR4 family protein [Bacteroidota bacterium]
MKTISESFRFIINKQIEIGYYMPKILREPANSIDIEKTENELEVKFNEELLELYSLADGINLDIKAITGLIDLIPNYYFLSLNNAKQFYKSHIEFQDLFLNQTTNIKPDVKLFPFLEDGSGNCYWVDLNIESDNYKRIYWTNTYGEEPDYLFESLTIMFQVISECYEKGIIKLNSEGYLEKDYDMFASIASIYNPKIKYWVR